MPRQSLRAVELQDAILDAAEEIDNTDQSRSGLSEGLDNVRVILAEAYGPDFEDDLAEKVGEFENDDDGADDPEIEEEDD